MCPKFCISGDQSELSISIFQPTIHLHKWNATRQGSHKYHVHDPRLHEVFGLVVLVEARRRRLASTPLVKDDDTKSLGASWSCQVNRFISGLFILGGTKTSEHLQASGSNSLRCLGLEPSPGPPCKNSATLPLGFPETSSSKKQSFYPSVTQKAKQQKGEKRKDVYKPNLNFWPHNTKCIFRRWSPIFPFCWLPLLGRDFGAPGTAATMFVARDVRPRQLQDKGQPHRA